MNPPSSVPSAIAHDFYKLSINTLLKTITEQLTITYLSIKNKIIIIIIIIISIYINEID